MILELAKNAGSLLVVVHAVETRGHLYEGMETVGATTEQRTNQARAQLKAMVEEGARQNVKVETAVIEGGPVETIFQVAEENDADVIAITVQEKGIVERTLLGAVAERMIRESHLPVLSIPVVRTSAP